jgi:hypothetical protein
MNAGFVRTTTIPRQTMSAARRRSTAVRLVFLLILLLSENTQSYAEPKRILVASPQPETVLVDGTPVRLRLTRTISPSNAHLGEEVYFEVAADVSVNGIVVILRGMLPMDATVTSVSRKRRFHHCRLEIGLNYIQLSDGELVPVRSVKHVRRQPPRQYARSGMVLGEKAGWLAMALFWPKADGELAYSAGTEVIAYINGDRKLELSQFIFDSNRLNGRSTFTDGS